MKIFTSILIILALIFLGVNISRLDFNQFTEETKIALIGILGSLCAILILVIFKLSKKIEQKTKL
ncbi:MAG: hypothetical protein NTX74_03425 [Flavobacterium sp.]|jgi:hypothetical protein|nr:hypothetical protein [Flavobacterium sp.]